MTNELITTNNQVVKEEITEKLLKDYLLGVGTKITDTQFTMFMGIAKSFDLNPFKREIYVISYGTTFNVVTGYQTYIERAMSTGLLDGWNVEKTDSGAKITIYRKDFKYPFEWEVETDEFIKKDFNGKVQGIWKTMPSFMIKKVAIGQGFRLAFPNELGGMPYLSEEITSEKESIPEVDLKKQEETKNKISSVGVTKQIKKDTEVLVDKSVEGGDKKGIIIIEPNTDTIEQISTDIVAKEQITIEGFIESKEIEQIADAKVEVTPEEVSDMFSSPVNSVYTLLEQFTIIKQKMKSPAKPEDIMKFQINKLFPGKTSETLSQLEIDSLSKTLQDKIDSL